MICRFRTDKIKKKAKHANDLNLIVIDDVIYVHKHKDASPVIKK